VKLSATTFSKANLFAANNVGSGSNTNYHRAVGVSDAATGAWLNARVENFLVKHNDGSFSAVDFAAAPPDTAVLSSPQAWAALASANFVLPVDAESLVVVLSVAGDKAISLSNSQNPLTLQFKAQTATGQLVVKNFPAATFVSNAPFNQSHLRLGVNTMSFSSGAQLIFNATINNLKTAAGVVASLGHIYEIIDAPTSKNLEKVADAATRQDFVLKAYPNPYGRLPFNPSTQIHFVMKEAGIAMLRVYNLHGQLIRELLNEYRIAGEHVATWDGRDDRGEAVSSGVYFIRFAAGNEVKVGKLMLVR
jgi:hypothetical protein